MCTNRTLDNHIKKYREIAEEIKRLEELKKAESAYIIAELDARNTTKYNGLSVITTRREDIPNKIVKSTFPEFWQEFHTVSECRYIR